VKCSRKSGERFANNLEEFDVVGNVQDNGTGSRDRTGSGRLLVVDVTRLASRSSEGQ
jgi:hypothetical protein